MTEQQSPSTSAPTAASASASQASPPPAPPADESWFYVDDSEEIQGPFPTAQMLAW